MMAGFDLFAVTRECSFPRGDGFAVPAQLVHQVAQVILDDRVTPQLVAGLLQMGFGQGELVELEVGPPQTV